MCGPFNDQHFGTGGRGTERAPATVLYRIIFPEARTREQASERDHSTFYVIPQIDVLLRQSEPGGSHEHPE